MTDQELLERAARAVGKVTTGLWSAGCMQTLAGWWNPLEDDGDALRLAVALGLTVEIYRNRVTIQTEALDEDGDEVEIDEVYRDHYDDPWVEAKARAATRRAIVRAAAAMADT